MSTVLPAAGVGTARDGRVRSTSSMGMVWNSSYEKWKDIVRISGPVGLRLIKGFHDETLRGEWIGHRSSRLGLQYRVIYRLVGQEILVEVIDITAHDYRRK